MRKLMLTFATVLVLGAVAPLAAGAAVSGTIEFFETGGSLSPPTDANGNGILDTGDYFEIDQTLEVAASSVSLEPVGTPGSLAGTLTIMSSSEARADLRLSVPNGSLHVSGLFSTSVFEGPSEPFDLPARGEEGVFQGNVGTMRVSPGESTTFLFTLWPAMSALPAAGDPPAACDPLVARCGGRPEAPDEPLLAPGSQSEDVPAAGRPRMPDLRGRLGARWNGSALEVRLRIRIARPRLARPFDVELRGEGFARTVRVLPRGRRSVLVRLTIPLSHAPAGKLTARIDAGHAMLEARERNNTVRAQIG